MTRSTDSLVAAHVTAYDELAEEFAERTAVMPPELVALGENILGRFPSPPSILDVGCGPGRDMAWFEQRAATVTGIDVSSSMLELARRQCVGELIAMDMRELALPDASFDVVWSIASLLHLPKADASLALAEFRRVVKPGGIVVVVVKAGDGERWERTGDWPNRLFARYAPAELRAAIEAVGLEVESVTETVSERGEAWLQAVARRCQAS
ncbi:MAG TPA: methyltransferase domain-containing protein [Gaiellaceae bacterium]